LDGWPNWPKRGLRDSRKWGREAPGEDFCPDTAAEVAVDHGSLSPPRGFSQFDEIRSDTSIGSDARLHEVPPLSFGGGALYLGAQEDPSDDTSASYSQNDWSDPGSEFSEPFGYDEDSHEDY